MVGIFSLVIDVIVNAYTILLVAYVLLSYMDIAAGHPLRHWLASVVEPTLSPLRRRIAPIGGMDVTPLVAWLVVTVIGGCLKAVLVAWGN